MMPFKCHFPPVWPWPILCNLHRTVYQSLLPIPLCLFIPELPQVISSSDILLIKPSSETWGVAFYNASIIFFVVGVLEIHIMWIPNWGLEQYLSITREVPDFTSGWHHDTWQQLAPIRFGEMKIGKQWRSVNKIKLPLKSISHLYFSISHSSLL